MCMIISAGKKKKCGYVPPNGSLELDQQFNPNTFLALLWLFLFSANCCFFPLVAPIRMIDEKRCRGDG